MGEANEFVTNLYEYWHEAKAIPAAITNSIGLCLCGGHEC